MVRNVRFGFTLLLAQKQSAAADRINRRGLENNRRGPDELLSPSYGAGNCRPEIARDDEFLATDFGRPGAARLGQPGEAHHRMRNHRRAR
jgi:hypothetical protein